MATHSSTLAWKIPWTEEPGVLPSVGLHRVGHDWSNLAAAATIIYKTDKQDLFTYLGQDLYLISCNICNGKVSKVVCVKLTQYCKSSIVK